jgi:hypothetical protein
MARHIEPLTGGLDNISDPATLDPGQLADAWNCYYLPGQGALQRSMGRTPFGTVSATAVDVVGLRDIQFDNSDQYLIGLASGGYYSAPVGDTGTFALVTAGIGMGTQLEAAQYRNRYYLFNGTTSTATTVANSNLVAYLSSTGVGSTMSVRPHGLLPVNTTPGATTAAGNFSQPITGYYEYWTTEVRKYTQDGVVQEVESTFVGNPVTVLVASTAQVPIITVPQPRNAGTTDWRLYRSTKKEFASDKAFPIGFKVAEAPNAVTAQYDQLTGNFTSYFLPTASNTGAQEWADAGSVSNAYSSSDGGAAMTLATTVGGGPKGQTLYGFAFTGVSGSITSIDVEVKAWVSAGAAPVRMNVKIGKRTSDSIDGLAGRVGYNNFKTGSQHYDITATTLGGANTVVFTGLWTQPDEQRLEPADFDGSFGVSIICYNSTYYSGPGSSPGKAATLSVDYARVRVNYGGTADTAVQFPTVVYEFGGINVQVGRNGPPSNASCGDFYEDSLVINDTTNPSLVRWSTPGEPDYFPSTYFLDIESRENDQVRAIRTVNSTLVVWLDSATYRLNYLPSERDSSFDRGKAMKVISSSFGCVGPMCVCTFSTDEKPELAAFVSNQGIHATDGFSFITLTDNIDWRTIISSTVTSTPIALINDRERRLLLFYFRNDYYTPETYLCLPLSYHAEHIINGKPKVGGLLRMRNYDAGSAAYADLKSAWAATRASGDASVYLGYGGSATAAGAGKVYRENGTAIPAHDPRMEFTTRRMYLNGMGNEWELGEVYGYAVDYGSTTPTLSYTTKTTKTNDTGETTNGAKTVTLAGAPLHKVVFRQMNEGAKITMQATASGLAFEQLIIDGTGFGLEDSGR